MTVAAAADPAPGGPPAAAIDPELLRSAFPFHLIVDGGGRVVASGPSLGRLLPGLAPGDALTDHLQVLSPIGLELSPAGAREHARSLVLLSGLDGRLTLRGQLASTGEHAILLGSPWITSPDQLAPLGLTLADFAVHDPVADFVMLLQSQQTALAEAERLAAELGRAAASQAALAEAERRLAAELDAIPDLVLRLDHSGGVIEARPAREDQLPAPPGALVGTSADALFPGWQATLPR